MKTFSKFPDKVESFNVWDSCQKSLDLSSAAQLAGEPCKSHFMLFQSNDNNTHLIKLWGGINVKCLVQCEALYECANIG